MTEQLKNVRAWLLENATAKHTSPLTKPGYTVLFDGANADKIQQAQLLGKEFNKEVHHVNVSQLVSKYIGETEKNLAAIFSEAQNKNWILFFDEADALFNKRTDVKDSHDRYANQQVNYLLQRLEDYPGLAIVSTNLKENVDDAFTRRFHSVVHFPTH